MRYFLYSDTKNLLSKSSAGAIVYVVVSRIWLVVTAILVEWFQSCVAVYNMIILSSWMKEEMVITTATAMVMQKMINSLIIYYITPPSPHSPELRPTAPTQPLMSTMPKHPSSPPQQRVITHFVTYICTVFLDYYARYDSFLYIYSVLPLKVRIYVLNLVKDLV